MTDDRRRERLGYLVALLAPAAAALVRAAVDPLFGDRMPYITFYAAIIVTAWYGGLRPALLSAVVSFLLAVVLFVPPRYSLHPLNRPDAIGVTMYFLVSFSVAVLGGAMRSSQIRALEAGELARRRGELLRVTLASIGDAVITTDTSGAVNYLNEVAQGLTGWTQADAAGRPLAEVFDIVNEETRQPVENPVEKVLRQGRIVGLANHTLLRARGGVERPIDDSAAPIRDDKGEVVGVVLVFHDISDRKKAEIALQHREAQMRLVADSAPVLLAHCDTRGVYKFVNRAYAERFGLHPRDVIGKRIPDVVGERAYASFRHHVDAVLAGQAVEFDLAIPYEVIGTQYMRAAYVPERGPSGEVVGLVAAIVNITDRKRAEEALRESERRKDDFLATLAHELRGPLAPVRNSLEVLKRDRDDENLQDQARATMERQLAHMVRLIDDLMDASRISRGKLDLQPERVSLADVVARAVETVRPHIVAAGQDLQVSLPPEGLALTADPVRLAQVLSNLLHNASKYSKPGGVIRLSAERRGGEVVVSVKDEGVGIPAGHFPRLFTMFSQVDSARERSQGGLGIGLALVKGLVELHAGRVEARSGGPGAGSEFVVTLPAVGEVVQVAPAKESRGAAGRHRVLIADDNRDSADSLARLLKMTGHDAQAVYDGQEAVEAAERLRPEVVLLDIGMPRLDGLQAARCIRAETWGKKTLLVAVTGWGDEQTREEARDAGFDAHLTKPVEYTELLGVVEELMKARQREL